MTASATTPGARVIVASAIFQTVAAERDKYRAALLTLSDDHMPDENGWCKECGQSSPCPFKDFVDETLGRGES